MLRGGRASGKSVFSVQLLVAMALKNPDSDIIVCRSSFSDLRNSTYQEILNWVEKYGLTNDFIPKYSPLRIYSRRSNCNIYFVGIGGADKHRTKSFKPEHDLIGVLFEELQQVEDQTSLEQAHASFRRFLKPNGVFIHAFNPEPQNAHWVNQLWNLKKQDPDWLCINTTYLDIINFLNDIDLKEIIKMKIEDYERYKWLYLGETGGGFGSVYPQFKRDKHYISTQKYNEKFGAMQIKGVIIGVDSAVTHDATAFVPLLIMSNGQAVVADIFYHDPKTSQQMSSAELIPYIKSWLDRLIKKFNLDDNFGAQVPIVFKVDSAAPEMVRQLAYYFSGRATINAFKKSTIVEMVGITQSALAKNMINIIDWGGYQDYIMNRWIRGNPLVVQLENLIWNDAQTGYEDKIPNDATDAFTYAVNSYFKNPDHLYWLDLKKEYYDWEEQE